MTVTRQTHDSAQTLVHALILGCVDYCNYGILYGLPEVHIHKITTCSELRR